MNPITAAVAKAIESLSGSESPRLVRLASHAGKVVKIAAGLADLIADDEKVGGGSGLVRRIILAGLPGVRLDIAAGDRVRFGFNAGAEKAVEVTAFEQDPSANRNAARKGDKVTLGTLTIQNIPPPAPPGSGVILSWMAASSPFLPSPPIPAIATIAGVGLTIAPTPFILSLEGWITSGSVEIFLRHVPTEAVP